ncbi:MAG: Lrp/AsnC family transcriptional regulator [Candidatus Marinimicrobia bacterium]|jgi:Lrp/AsnC family transcriptional regulator, leucine-responsive regulatory protein|nr:Lrp/AsnC family transcriptional regulator [Candidatus Neomarinimicrobiota bacterium]
MINLDHIDKQIISILQQKGRDSASHIATEIGMSVPAVTDRIRKLQDAHVITGFQAIVDPRMVGLDVSALITIISESSEHYTEVVESAKNTLEVVQCFTTTGNGSHVLIIQTENTRSLERLLRQIQAWPGVMRTETQIILSNYK